MIEKLRQAQTILRPGPSPRGPVEYCVALRCLTSSGHRQCRGRRLLSYRANMVKLLTCLWTSIVWQVPTSVIPEEGDTTSHMHLTFYSNISSVVGAYKHLVPASVGSKTYQRTYSLPLTCKAISFIYKRGCAPSNVR